MKHRIRKTADAREAQLIWTFCVGIAVLIAALYQVSTPRGFFMSQSNKSMPEAVRTGNPLSTSSKSLSLPALQRHPASGNSAETH